MQLWNEILRLGIIGLSNIALPKDISSSIISLGLRGNTDSELLLEGISAISLIKRTQIKTENIKLDESQIADAESEDLNGLP